MEKRNNTRGATDDLVLLDDISEKGVVDNLRNRYDNDLIYTYIGEVLVSVNPFKNIPGLYKRGLMERYFGRQKFELAPHVFASAEHAFRNLMTHSKNQCVLISGESGAGKTEAAKKLLEYVTVVSEDRAETNDKLSVAEIKDALLRSNPVMEAFGNAKTLRNDNSSRFGKYLVVNFDYGGTPLGGSIKTYLLEKPRVVGQTTGERNFHVFYQLCAGSSDRELGLGSASDFEYTRGTTSVRGMDDAAEFREMDEAMGHVGLSSSDKKEIFRLVAAVLHIGNIEFDGKRDRCAVKKSSSKAVSKAASLLNVSERDLEKALTHRTITSRTESVTSPLTSVDECIKTRDALAKVLYSRNFLKIVELINKAIHTDMNELSLGVLDIYGFEIFETNSFEQLCINYCNEKLQQLFIELTLKREQDEYAREGIKWSKIDFFNNKIVCDLIEAKKPAGVIAYLDEECIIPRGSDKGFLSKLETNLARHKHYGSLATKTNHAPKSFLIRHYAGDVVYNAQGIVDKNKDTLFQDLKMLVQSSRSDYIAALVPEGHDGKKPVTAGTAFVRDMQALIDDLSTCEPHYIRTIKPNDRKSSGLYDTELVEHQVRYLGVVENVRVRRAGFAFRSDYNYFANHFKMLSDRTWPKTSGNDKRDTEAILQAVGVKKYEMGKTKVFVEEPEDVFKLEEAREKQLHVIVRVIQKAYRAYKSRLYFLRLRLESAELLHQQKRRRQSWVLYYLGDYVFAQDNEAITSQFGMGSQERVTFADHVDIVGPKNAMARHLLVVTKASLYIFNKAEKLVNSIALRDITSFGLSTFADGFIIANYTAEKPVPSLIMETFRKAEICMVIKAAYEKAAGRELTIDFKDVFPVVMQKKTLFGKKLVEKQLIFREDSMLDGVQAMVRQPTKQDTPEFKQELWVNVSATLGSRAPYQLDSEFPERLNKHKIKKGTRKKIVYGGYRKNKF